jgi:SAM-dependent methyltransferase
MTCTLHAAVRLDIFTALAEGTASVESISERLGSSVDATERLLNALVAMGLVEKSNGRYANSQAAASFLSRKSEKYLGYMIKHHSHLVENWSNLHQAVLTGLPVKPGRVFDEEERREGFLMGMFNNAMLMAPRLVAEIDLGSRRRLLDLGGGPGTYAIHFCLHNPHLRASVYDLPTTRPFAEETIQRFQLSSRINFVDGDYVAGEIDGPFDVIWMSHILHGEGPETCANIIRKASRALEPGGLMLIHDFFLNETRDGPLFPALFSLNMLLGTEGGRSYTEQEVAEMMSAAGIGTIRRSPFVGPTDSGILVGTV